ncbi:Z1 domain-containing protein [Actinomycetospora lemnae]|uniref:Z1 domain-containing protein n=1 Tax=Actinomycetospora lemnae TaxID=3019891 RepID=A0ABT5SXX1_9PSEU|nr:Z1 domain-containing protein [Actinomycetospora sp. DW7H6]MDD7966558.1 Z1 domain-containing protein [Actinomycetospora sp. DW7H6]
MAARANGEPVPESFDHLKKYVAEAIAEMTSGGAHPVLLVNSDKSVQDQQESLDFDKGSVWRILVGGTKLSRGFTLEGLTVSYFRRKAGQADTLMQAGRWFGFREGYRDLVRLYIRRDHKVDLYEAFEALLLDEEAFRDELAKYAGFDEDGKPILEPRQIPPLVSQHLPWLKPTARNKMFNAVVKARASVGAFHQLSSVPERTEKSKHAANLRQVIIPLLAVVGKPVALPYVDPTDGQTKQQRARVGLLGASEFLALFDKMTWHADYDTVIKPLREFVATATQRGRIEDWAVVWPQRQSPGRMVAIDELGLDAPVWRRKRRQPPRIDFTGENKRNILSAGAIPEGAEVETLGHSETRKAGRRRWARVAQGPEQIDPEPARTNPVRGCDRRPGIRCQCWQALSILSDWHQRTRDHVGAALVRALARAGRPEESSARLQQIDADAVRLRAEADTAYEAVLYDTPALWVPSAERDRTSTTCWPGQRTGMSISAGPSCYDGSTTD